MTWIQTSRCWCWAAVSLEEIRKGFDESKDKVPKYGRVLANTTLRIHVTFVHEALIRRATPRTSCKRRSSKVWLDGRLPRGSTYTTIRELGPIIPSIVWYFGARFLNSCIYGPSGLWTTTRRGMSWSCPMACSPVREVRSKRCKVGIIYIGFRVSLNSRRFKARCKRQDRL